MDSQIQRGGAYSIDEQTICDLVQTIRKHVGKDPTIELEFGDRSGDRAQNASKTAEEILDDSLTRTGLIKTFRVSGSNYDVPDAPSANLRIGADGLLDPVMLRASGSADGCAIIKAELDRIIDAARARYSWLYPSNPAIILVPAGIVSILVASLLVAVTVVWSRNPEGSGLMFVGWFGLCLLFLSWARRFFFPQVTFEIGRSRNIAIRAKSRRNIAFVVVGLGMVVSIVSGLAVRWL